MIDHIGFPPSDSEMATPVPRSAIAPSTHFPTTESTNILPASQDHIGLPPTESGSSTQILPASQDHIGFPPSDSGSSSGNGSLFEDGRSDSGNEMEVPAEDNVEPPPGSEDEGDDGDDVMPETKPAHIPTPVQTPRAVPRRLGGANPTVGTPTMFTSEFVRDCLNGRRVLDSQVRFTEDDRTMLRNDVLDRIGEGTDAEKLDRLAQLLEDLENEKNGLQEMWNSLEGMLIDAKMFRDTNVCESLP